MKRFILLITLLITNICVYAQDSVKIKKDTLKLDETSIVGIRGDAKTPISQKTVTKADIDKIYQGQEISYILSDLTPSVSTQSDGGQLTGYTTFRIRGIDQTRINMTINGSDLSEPEDMGVYFSNYPDFAINIQSMQIQRGVGTSSSGVSSFGGSINFQSNDGSQPGGTVQLGYGAFNTSHFNISNSTGLIDKKFSLFTSVSLYNSDGYKYHAFGEGYSGFVSGQYIINTKNTIKFTGFLGRSLTGQSWLAVYESDINKDPRTNDDPKGETDNFSQNFAQLAYTHAFTPNSYIVTTGFYNNLIGRWGMYLDQTNPTPSTLLTYYLHSNFFGLTSNYHLQASHLKLDIGIDANTYNRTHSVSLPDSGRLYVNTGYKKQLAEYVKVGYDINKFTLFGDVQERYVNFQYVGDASIPTLQWNFVNPKGGLTYNYNTNVNYYASVGESYREPTRTDLFGGNDNLILPLGSTTPERVVDYELGTNIKYNKLKIQGNLYYMDFHNEITLEGALGSNGLPLMTQVNKSYRSGLELDIRYNILNHFTLTNTSNFSRNYFTGNGGSFQPLYTPCITLNQGLEYANNNFSIGLLAKYQSLSYISLDNKFNAPEFIIFNSNISYKINKFTLMGQLNNITNRSYFTNGYVISNERYFFVNAPRSAYVTLKYTW